MCFSSFCVSSSMFPCSSCSLRSCTCLLPVYLPADSPVSLYLINLQTASASLCVLCLGPTCIPHHNSNLVIVNMENSNLAIWWWLPKCNIAFGLRWARGGSGWCCGESPKEHVIWEAGAGSPIESSLVLFVTYNYTGIIIVKCVTVSSFLIMQ